ncbi:MAG TPA: phosphoenolpyruvate--protein phosphotransferase [Anaeromyxobacter sp.]|nr:phosphoenolpyruvate--protein phosphotransferase [Anaeromyxobacter sp.]
MASAPLELMAVVTGRAVPIESVPDPAFAEKMVGDGIAIEPEASTVTAPCDGRVVQVHRSRHAYGIRASTGAQVLVHVGLDTVELKGDGFRPRVQEGQEVKAGQPLVEFDRAVLSRRGVSQLTLVVVENMDEHPVTWRAAPGAALRGGADRILRLGGAVEVEPPAAPVPGPRAEGRAVVKHAEGLHARPAALVADAARRFRSAVEVRFSDRAANARSPIALMSLCTAAGDEVEVVATGPDAEAARDAVVRALEQVVAQAAHPPAAAQAQAAPGPSPGSSALGGVVASAGVAVGETFHLRWEAPQAPELGRGEGLERADLERALREVAADIEAAVARAQQRRTVEEVAILEAHRALIEDPELFGRAAALVAAGKGAAWAFAAVVREQCAVLQASGSALLAERVADLRDLSRQVVARIMGRPPVVPELPARALLLAEDLSPGELALLDRSRLAGIVTQLGGPTAHVAIVARSQQIPALVAVGPGLRAVPDGQLAVLDAERGVLDWRPSAAALEAAGARMTQADARRQEASRSAGAPAVTRDGVRVEVAANVSRPDEAAAAGGKGADAVGLLRTELIFAERETAPTEEEQRAAYQAVVDALGGRTVIIRTLDVGADKQLAYLPQAHEENPALGLRGVRLSLARPELLAEQLRACLRVRPLSLVRLMLPMVTDLEDVLRAREVLRAEASRLGVPPPQLGVMVETPAAALLADQLAPEVDFLSLGTNDLTQYTLAMDRTNASVAARLDDLHPAVLRLVAQAAAGAARHGKWIGVCGGLASDPLAVPLLLGMGVTELSVGPGAVAEVKELVRRLDRRTCAELAQRAQALPSAAAVRELVRTSLAGLWPPTS